MTQPIERRLKEFQDKISAFRRQVLKVLTEHKNSEYQRQHNEEFEKIKNLESEIEKIKQNIDR
jgi:peptidoglycan hydrolase CwlO-like protein